MGRFLTKTPSDRPAAGRKNRVPGRSAISVRSRPGRSRLPSPPRRKPRPTATKLVPGIPCWPSRDPIGERGGENLYGFALNRSANAIDDLGGQVLLTPMYEPWVRIGAEIGGDGLRVVRPGISETVTPKSPTTTTPQVEPGPSPLEPGKLIEYPRTLAKPVPAPAPTPYPQPYVGPTPATEVKPGPVNPPPIPPDDSERKRCTPCQLIGPLPRIGSFDHTLYAMTLGAGEWELITPSGVKVRYDSMGTTGPGMKVMYEAKTGHEFMFNQSTFVFGKAYLRLLVQFSLQAAVAAECKYGYQIAVDNERGAEALRAAFPLYPISYRPWW